jgi:hypothetical protein
MRTTADIASVPSHAEEVASDREAFVPGSGPHTIAQRLSASPHLTAQRARIRQAFGPGVVQLKPPADPNVFTFEDENGLVWSRDADDRWYRPGDSPSEKVYWPASVALPSEPTSVNGNGDGYRQIWTVGAIQYIFSSGHGYRPNHHPPNQDPSLDITALGSMNDIELAILAHIVGPGGIPAVGVSGTRPITFAGEPVEYRFKRFSPDKMGIGTYYRPD